MIWGEKRLPGFSKSHECPVRELTFDHDELTLPMLELIRGMASKARASSLIYQA